MIQFRRSPLDPQPVYKIKVKSDIGNFKKDEVLTVQVITNSGRIYKPGKDQHGKFIDTEGKPDERIMIFGTDPKDFKASKYACNTKEVINEHFEEIV